MVKNCYYENLMAIKPNDYRAHIYFKYFEKNYTSLENV